MCIINGGVQCTSIYCLLCYPLRYLKCKTIWTGFQHPDERSDQPDEPAPEGGGHERTVPAAAGSTAVPLAHRAGARENADPRTQ